MSQLEKYILVTLFVVFAVVFARWLKRFLRRNEIQETFPYVFPFDSTVVEDNQLIKMELPFPQKVKGELILPNGDLVELLFDETLQAGIQTKNMRTAQLANGPYELRITFSNQVTNRKLEVKR
jgi:hypothetical protein